MTKNELRQSLRESRRRFVADQRIHRPAMEQSLAERVLAHLNGATIVGAYLSDGEEVDPLPILKAVQGRGVTTALPHITDRKAPMRFLRWSPGDALHPGRYGLLQPAAEAPEVEPDLILAPLVGFDRAMHRLGQGAGFYDRAFARLPAARRIGLAWSVQEANRLPTDEWDVPLHAVATEQQWIEPDA